MSLDAVGHLASGVSALVPVQLRQRTCLGNILRRSPDRTPIVTANEAAAASRAVYCNSSFFPSFFLFTLRSHIPSVTRIKSDG